ncbi:tonB-system energizer ExbB [Xanthobacter sp. TB0139]|uniref:tonB-system energizer ExbB n=1 Tax=Xanthobacter sp. TB0139 TaxID=3459178 RepID=UPI0040391264
MSAPVASAQVYHSAPAQGGAYDSAPQATNPEPAQPAPASSAAPVAETSSTQDAPPPVPSGSGAAPASSAPVPAASAAQAPAQTTAPADAGQTLSTAETAQESAQGQGARQGAGQGDNQASAPETIADEPAAEEADTGSFMDNLNAPASTLPHDLSPWGMFMAADWVVKAVMIGLAFASVVTWTIWVAKSLELAIARRTVRRTLKVLRNSATLEEAARLMPNGQGPAQAALVAALDEWKASEGLPADGVKERVVVVLNRIEAAAGRRMQAGTGILATIGATAPFVGLFGTVWGIMNSFIGISKAQTTNLAIVAPGIAEALLATAIGLVAAIPAVVIYNVFARAIAGYRASLADTSSEVLRHLSRDLDREARDEGKPALRAAAE